MKIKLLTNGAESFEAVIRNIKRTKSEILINMFIWRDDRIGNEILKELIAAAKRGIKIKILKDSTGGIFERSEENKKSLFHKEYSLFSWLKQKTIEFGYSSDLSHISDKQVNNPLLKKVDNNKNFIIEDKNCRRDHSKFYIFDKKKLITGGMNIEDRAQTQDVRSTTWLDYMIEIEDTDYVNYFLLKLEDPLLESENLDPQIVLNKSGRFLVKRKMLELIRNSKKKLYIEMAYLGKNMVMKEIIAASRRGVKITIVIPKMANLQSDYNHKILKNLLKKTNDKIEAFICSRMLHAKMLYSDDSILLIGSANLNNSSLNKFAELDLLFKKDIFFKKKLNRSLKNNLRLSQRVRKEDIKYNRIKAFCEGFFT